MKIHIVQKGDTLWEIAQKYDVNFDELVQLNSHLASPDMIMPGMKIRIPANTKTIKKDGKKLEQKTVKSKKDIAPQAEMQPKQPKKIEVPKLPKLPEEKAVTLPSLDITEEHYPTTMFPEMPAEKKKVKQEKPKKEVPQKPSQPEEQQPVYHMPQQPAYNPCAQMMPAYYYPMMMPQHMGCGCCGQQMHMPYYPYQMYGRQYPSDTVYPYAHPAAPNHTSVNEQQLYPTPPAGKTEN